MKNTTKCFRAMANRVLQVSMTHRNMLSERQNRVPLLRMHNKKRKSGWQRSKQ